jgi:hypothetical protein
VDVNVNKLSMEEQHIYMHYLWRELISCNHQKKRIILEHVRNSLPAACDYLVAIFLRSVYQSDLQPTSATVHLLA